MLVLIGGALLFHAARSVGGDTANADAGVDAGAQATRVPSWVGASAGPGVTAAPAR